ncbi:MAG: glucose-6-phosphate dehydrogenase [Dictyoglomus sp. NZ13-RE01]|nr:MAG: glucose-6-phosphate dehydrogenase [Dictyoglomus sp. NZ13-RE01]
MNKYSIIILGGWGDLARKKIYPALFNLYKNFKLLDCKNIIAVGRRNVEEKEFLDIISKEVSNDPDFLKLWRYVNINLEIEEDYKNLKPVIGEEELIFYLAIPPFTFKETLENLGKFLKTINNKRKIVIEKPFGMDLNSAKELNNLLKEYFKEEEIYRIDHFLGKETVQNIFGLRFSNIIFEGIWNKNFIDHVQISALEDIGIEGRAQYYDNVGALRDMIQNHLLQILTLTAMEPPCCIEEKAIRNEKIKVLKSIREIKYEEVPNFAVRGQYEGYLNEEGVKPNSRTETYALVKFYVDNLRWDGVPFYLRTGKKLYKKETSVVIVFKKIPGLFSKLLDCMPEEDQIIFKISPENKILLKFQLRPLGKSILSCPIPNIMEWSAPNIDAYETLFIDIIEGDQTLFIRDDEIEKSWEIIQNILDFWKEDPHVPIYKVGSYGPKEADEFIKKDGREWK